MNVTQISIGRFHHFHLARQLEMHGLLDAIYTGYPIFKLKDEQGIPYRKIKSYPWLRTPFMMRGRLGLDHWDWLNKEWEWLGQQTIDKYAATNIHKATTVVALSSSGLYAGQKAQMLGGRYICDRGSSHIRFQNEILEEEYKIWGFTFPGIDGRIIKKEEAEYEACDIITVPSEFVKQSFIDKGIPESKLRKAIYGARLERFVKVADPDWNKFNILWVGSVNLRKGFMYLLKAFQALKHPNKQLTVIGEVAVEIKQLLSNQNLDGIRFIGNVPNSDLPFYYSTAHVFVLPSVEEGLAMVMGEALGCGCPVIASANTGAADLFTDREEGFIIPIRSVEILKERLQSMMDSRYMQQEMSHAGMEKVKSAGGWDTYGNQFVKIIQEIENKVEATT